MISTRFLPVVFVALLACSCLKDAEDVNFMMVNDQKFRLSYGIIEDVKFTDLDKMYRIYKIELISTSSGLSSHFFQFKIYSRTTTMLAEGNYHYRYDNPYNAGDFTYCKLGYNMIYDQDDVPTHGTIIKDSPETTGTMTITKSGTRHRIEFDMEFVKQYVPYKVTGIVNTTLQPGEVYLDND